MTVTDKDFTELSNKVAVLEERTQNEQDQLNRIENKLENHAAEEEILLRNLNKSLVEFKDSIEVKIDEAVMPIRDDVNKYKGILQALGWALTAIGVIAGFFREAILKHFT